MYLYMYVYVAQVQFYERDRLMLCYVMLCYVMWRRCSSTSGTGSPSATMHATTSSASPSWAARRLSPRCHVHRHGMFTADGHSLPHRTRAAAFTLLTSRANCGLLQCSFSCEGGSAEVVLVDVFVLHIWGIMYGFQHLSWDPTCREGRFRLFARFVPRRRDGACVHYALRSTATLSRGVCVFCFKTNKPLHAQHQLARKI